MEAQGGCYAPNCQLSLRLPAGRNVSLESRQEKKPNSPQTAVPKVMPELGGGMEWTIPATAGPGTGPHAHRQPRQRTSTSIPPGCRFSLTPGNCLPLKKNP